MCCSDANTEREHTMCSPGGCPYGGIVIRCQPFSRAPNRRPSSLAQQADSWPPTGATASRTRSIPTRRGANGYQLPLLLIRRVAAIGLEVAVEPPHPRPDPLQGLAVAIRDAGGSAAPRLSSAISALLALGTPGVIVEPPTTLLIGSAGMRFSGWRRFSRRILANDAERPNLSAAPASASATRR